MRQSAHHRHAQADTADQRQPAITEKSIAVLPVADLSEKHDQEYFADGIADEILNTLVRIPELKVIGRTSSFQFRAGTDDLRRIGSVLGAEYVLEGSLRRSADHIRITAQLIDTRNGMHRWSEIYDRTAADVLKVQDEIAASVGRALELEVTSVNQLRETQPPNGEAFDAYLRGLHALDRYDQAGIEAAMAHSRQSIELGPSFVPPREGLAGAFEALSEWGFLPPTKGFEEARSAAEAALRVDPKSVIAHTILCGIHTVYDWDWDAADREATTAMTLAPHNEWALSSVSLLVSGRVHLTGFSGIG